MHERHRRRLLFVLLAMAFASSEARRHRYGYRYGVPAQRQVQRRIRPEEDEATLDAIEDDIVEAATAGADGDWPPRWFQPVLVVCTLWYSSFFF